MVLFFNIPTIISPSRENEIRLIKKNKAKLVHSSAWISVGDTLTLIRLGSENDREQLFSFKCPLC